MAFTCSKCGYVGPFGVILFNPDGSSSEYCRIHRPSTHVDKAKNPYANFTLEHARDEHGRKITVNSQRELRAAEKRHNFALAIASDDKAGGPPQHEPWAGDIAHNYRRKFNLDPAAYKDERGKRGVSAGIAKSADDTLAAVPNPINH